MASGRDFTRRGRTSSGQVSTQPPADDITFNTDATDPTKKIPFVVGGDNTAYYEQQQNDTTSWIDNLNNTILDELRAAGESAGYSDDAMIQIFDGNISHMLTDLDRELMRGQATSLAGRAYRIMEETPVGMRKPADASVYLTDRDGIEATTNYARAWFQMRFPELQKSWEIGTGKSRGSGGGGTRGPTAEQIRQQFDVDQLAAAAQNRWRGTLLTETDQSRAIAEDYIEEIVASGGKQKIDFDTYVDKRIEATDRFASIYANKPKSMSLAQYLQPYVQSAQQIVGATDEAAQIGIQGAQFGASGAAFQARLNRTDAVTSSSPFINKIGQRMTALKGMLRG
jgi:hypothetical protein